MTNPITPPPELVEQLRNSPSTWLKKLTIAYQAGADMQFEACGKAIEQAWEMDHVESVHDLLREFRAACRPKPPSLKDQALAELEEIMDLALNYTELHGETGSAFTASAIRRALEALDD
jgi:hypothetical protein